MTQVSWAPGWLAPASSRADRRPPGPRSPARSLLARVAVHTFCCGWPMSGQSQEIFSGLARAAARDPGQNGSSVWSAEITLPARSCSWAVTPYTPKLADPLGIGLERRGPRGGGPGPQAGGDEERVPGGDQVAGHAAGHVGVHSVPGDEVARRGEQLHVKTGLGLAGAVGDGAGQPDRGAGRGVRRAHRVDGHREVARAGPFGRAGLRRDGRRQPASQGSGQDRRRNGEHGGLPEDPPEVRRRKAAHTWNASVWKKVRVRPGTRLFARDPRGRYSQWPCP